MTKRILITLVFLLLILTGCNSNKAFKNGYAIVYQDGVPYLLNNKNETFDLSKYEEVGERFDDYIIVKKFKNQKLVCGYINRDGKEVIKPKYEQAYPFSEGYAVVVEKGVYKLINTSNKVVYTFPDGVRSYDYIIDGHLRVEKDGLYSFLRISDFYLHNTYYEGLENFSSGYALYHYYDSNKVKRFNFLDKNFNNLFTEDKIKEYDSVESFYDGYAKVGRFVGSEYYYSYINSKGELLKDSNDNHLFKIARNFSNGAALIYTGAPSHFKYSSLDPTQVISSFHFYQYLLTNGTYLNYFVEIEALEDSINPKLYFHDFVGNLTAKHYYNSGAGYLTFFKKSGNSLVEIVLKTTNIQVNQNELTYYPTPYELVAMRNTPFYGENETVLMVVRIQTNYCGIIDSDGNYLTSAIYDRVVL